RRDPHTGGCSKVRVIPATFRAISRRGRRGAETGEERRSAQPARVRRDPASGLTIDHKWRVRSWRLSSPVPYRVVSETPERGPALRAGPYVANARRVAGAPR